MVFLKIVIAFFLVMEITNIAALYFFPETKLANSVGIFNAWEGSKAYPEIHNFVKYLVYWVAGTKLIFILVLGMLLFTADDKILVQAAGALVLAIASFFWRLFPQIKKMDRNGEISPVNYSRILGWMIASMIVVFGAGILIAILI